MYRRSIWPVSSKVKMTASFILVTILVTGVAFGQTIKINFQPSTVAIIPTDYLPDYGEVFGDRGNGYSYGWDQDITGDMRTRGAATDPYKTLAQMQEGDPRTWEIELPNGIYDLFLACGDASYDDQINTLDVEGVIVTDQDGRSYLDEYNVSVTVSDGRLTIKPAPGGVKCKIMFIHITRVAMLKAYGPVPADKATHSESSVTLSWTSGDYAVSHNVYFGENLDEVNSGSGDTFKGNQLETSFVVDGLASGATYYWRIDEVNDSNPESPWKGDVWSFSLPIVTAYNPEPPDGADFVHTDAILSWTAGFNAQSHTVYIDDNFNDVNNATGGVPQAETTYAPGIFAKETTYFWRVDEFDGVTTHKGDIWSFTTIPYVPITDPNLLCWWKFDEIIDNTVIDYSGYDHFGDVYGASLELVGRVGAALYFGGDGDYVVDEDAENYLNGLDAITVCMWIKADQTGTDRGFIDCVEPNGKDQMVTMRHDVSGSSWGGRNVFKVAVTSTTLDPNENYEQQLESSNNSQTTEWQHVALVWKSKDVIRFYIDGREDAPSGRTDPNENSGTITGCQKLIIGKGAMDQGINAGWKGMIDDVRIYDIVLTEDEVKQAMRGESDLAWNPSPANTSTPDLKNALPLRWAPGENAVEHDVYFGTNGEAVSNADTSDTTGIYRGRQSAASYNPPEGVQWDSGPYYWRIDEVNSDGTISKGRLWQFIVADFILVEDFEDYNDYEPNRIFDVWADGWNTPTTNGAVVGYDNPNFFAGEHFVETVDVHSGSQSMPYFYDNTTAKNSEATLILDYPRNWTEQGVNVLKLWFKGYPAGFKEGPAGTYAMAASGADISGTVDEFRYVYKQLSGEGSISAKVISVDDTHEWAKAGVMIRRMLDNTSPFAAVYITPGNGCRFQARLTPATDSTSDTSVSTPEQREITAPYWVKIERDSLDDFYGYYSSDGVNWQPMAWNPQYIPMPSNVYIGLALTSHNVNAICKAKFSDVKTTGSVTPATWTNLVIGTEMLSNDSEPMYVAIANSTGSPVVVYHDNPNAAQIDTWTEWNINLQEFQGINLTDVDSITIGFGNKSNPQVGGSGKMFFDDIRLYR
jgi:hypothetical protein